MRNDQKKDMASTGVIFGCHIDLEAGMEPDGCVVDLGDTLGCNHAMLKNGPRRSKWGCRFWRPTTDADHLYNPTLDEPETQDTSHVGVLRDDILDCLAKGQSMVLIRGRPGTSCVRHLQESFPTLEFISPNKILEADDVMLRGLEHRIKQRSSPLCVICTKEQYQHLAERHPDLLNDMPRLPMDPADVGVPLLV